MGEEQESFANSSIDLQEAVGAFSVYYDMAKLDTYVAEVNAVMTRLRKAEAEAQKYNSREQLLGVPITDYSHIRKLIEMFDPFASFWSTAASWRTNMREWADAALEKLNGEQVEKEVSTAYKVMSKSAKYFATRGLDKVASNCEAVKAEAEEFKRSVPLVQALCNPGMRERHWAALSAELGGVELHPRLQLSQVLQLDVLRDQSETVVRTSEVASKEHGIERTLDKMAGDWDGVALQVLEYRDTGERSRETLYSVFLYPVFLYSVLLYPVFCMWVITLLEVFLAAFWGARCGMNTTSPPARAGPQRLVEQGGYGAHYGARAGSGGSLPPRAHAATPRPAIAEPTNQPSARPHRRPNVHTMRSNYTYQARTSSRSTTATSRCWTTTS